MTNQNHFSDLITQYINNTINKEAYIELMACLKESENEGQVQASMDEAWNDTDMLIPYSKAEAEIFYNRLITDKRFLNNKEKATVKLSSAATPASKNKKIVSLMAAAAVVAMILSGIYFFNSNSSVTASIQGAEYAASIKAGKNTATLTLADGKTISLSDQKEGVVISASGLKYNDNTSIANAGNLANATQVVASTPRGATYQVTLSDGTRVWMNADSKISFLSKFSAEERRISLTGEAYFEVAKDGVPFIVETANQEIEVLGTHFNVMAYTNEQIIKTTLLEGAVEVRNGQAAIQKSSLVNSVLLKPGEQAVNNGVIKVQSADIEQVIAWKKGSIVFKDKNLEGIMQELSRWYDITVVYAPDAPKNETFSGAVSRSRSLLAVLEGMQTTGSVKFKVQGRTVTVTK